MTWGVPLLLALLIGMVLFDRLGVRVQLGVGSQPQTVALGEIVDLPLASTDTPMPEPSATSTVEAVALPAENVAPALVAERPMPTATPEPLATASSTPTGTATVTQTPNPTSTFTATPAPAPTLDATSYTVQSGDTPAGIARRFGVTVDDLLAANDLTLADATRIRAGTVLVIPAGGSSSSTTTAAVPPAATPAPAVTYTLQSGDTLSSIAQRFGITVNNLLAANGLSAQDATVLQIGQVLIIPASGQTFPTRTPVPTTRTPVPSAASPTPVPTQASTLRLDAPVLLGPESGTPMRCTAIDSLTWRAVPFMGPGDEYELHLGFISGPPQANGSETISWAVVLRRPQPSWQLESGLCIQAPQEYNRQWRWYVQVVNGDTPVSPPSSIWAFSWN